MSEYLTEEEIGKIAKEHRWTIGAGSADQRAREAGLPEYWLKLGPVTLMVFRDEWLDVTRKRKWYFEVHWMNDLKLAIPDWRKGNGA